MPRVNPHASPIDALVDEFAALSLSQPPDPPPTPQRALPGAQAMPGGTDLPARRPPPASVATTSASTAGRTGPPLELHQIELAAYHLAAKAFGTPIEPPDAKRLRSATESVEWTRQQFRFGTGNLENDRSHTDGEGAARLLAARKVSQDPSEKLACSWALGAGNCGEHASLATIAHATRLHEEAPSSEGGRDEAIRHRVVRATLGAIDHAVAVEHALVRNPPEGDPRSSAGAAFVREPMVLDAWARGPAVMLSHSTWRECGFHPSGGLEPSNAPEQMRGLRARKAAYEDASTARGAHALSKLALARESLRRTGYSQVRSYSLHSSAVHTQVAQAARQAIGEPDAGSLKQALMAVSAVREAYGPDVGIRDATRPELVRAVLEAAVRLDSLPYQPPPEAEIFHIQFDSDDGDDESTSASSGAASPR